MERIGDVIFIKSEHGYEIYSKRAQITTFSISRYKGLKKLGEIRFDPETLDYYVVASWRIVVLTSKSLIPISEFMKKLEGSKLKS